VGTTIDFDIQEDGDTIHIEFEEAFGERAGILLGFSPYLVADFLRETFSLSRPMFSSFWGQ